MGRVKKFVRLSNFEKRLFVEAYLILGLMRLAVSNVSFKRLTKKLQKSEGERVMSALQADTVSVAEKIGEVIRKASKNTPWESACLAQALTAEFMLKRRGIPGIFYLGVMKDESVPAKMKAHAWSKCADRVLTGAPYEGFTVLSSFSWEGA